MTHLILLGVVLTLCAFIYFLRRFSSAWSMSNCRRTQGELVPGHHPSRKTAEAVMRPLSWHSAALAALICALILVVLAARLWLA